MASEELLIYIRRASPRQVAAAGAAAALLLVGFLATIPVAGLPLPRYSAFIPVVDAVLVLVDGLTAAVLLSQAVTVRSRALVALAAGYLFSAFLIVPHGLSFPGAFAPAGLIGGGTSTTIWLNIFWHCGLPIAVIAYALLRSEGDGSPDSGRAFRPTVYLGLAAAALAAAGLTLLATAGHDLLPSLMGDASSLSSWKVSVAALTTTVLPAAAILAVWRGPRSLLDIWLMVALWAWLLESLTVLWTAERYDLGWYTARLGGMLSGVFVLAALLVEIGRLYMQAALSNASEQQQREGRLMSLDAAAAAIAHEVKQPITAMVTNASAALIRVEKDQPDLPKVAHALRQIVADGHRAADTIAEIRALFGRHDGSDESVDLNQLVRETLELRSVELASRGILTTDDLAADLPELPVRPQQMRQVLVNLLNNAIEALDERPAGPRRLIVTSAPTASGGVMIDIGDSGRGIAAGQTERIFDAFFTTKTYGTGMGLPLCRSIVEGHGGKLSVTSVEGKGTTFHVELPGPQG